MPNTSTAPIIVHAHTAVTIVDHVTHLLGVLSTASYNAHATSTSESALVSTTKGTGVLADIRVYTYSVDGIIHKDSYVSDI